MDRTYVYSGELPAAADILQIQRSTLEAIGGIMSAAIGSASALDGLVCTPTVPASLAVAVGAGTIFTPAVIDGVAFGELPASLSATMKSGFTQSQTIPLAVPQSAGQQIVYLLQVSYQEIDAQFIVENFYNAANPSQPFAGPGNSGSALPKRKLSQCIMQPKAGVPALIGQATPPSADYGWVPAYWVTVNAGDTAITADRIVFASGAPFVRQRLTSSPTDLSGFALRSDVVAEAAARHTEVSNEAVARNSFDVSEQAARVAADAYLQSAIDNKRVGFKNLQAFTTNQNWTVPTNVDRARVTCVGGGAGGGSSGATLAGAGGGAGGTGISVVTGLTPGQVIALSVGVFGVGGANGTDGSFGGTTSFGTYITATGANGGQGGNNGQAGGGGGSAVGATLNIGGGLGGDASSGLSRGGDGASSSMGGGGRAATVVGASQNGVAWGSGGGGGYLNANTHGGSGQQGIIVIEW